MTHFLSQYDEIVGYTYVRAQSPGLDRTLRQELAAFSNDLRRNSGTDRGAGQVSLEFYQKRKRWIGQEDIPWEVWTVRCELVHLVNEQERLRLQEKVGEMLSDKVCHHFLFSSTMIHTYKQSISALIISVSGALDCALKNQ